MVSYEALKNRPRIVVNDETNYLALDGDGGEVPVFIVDSAVAPSDKEDYELPSGETVSIPKMELKSYSNQEAIATDLGDCSALDVVKEFLNEAKVQNTTQLGVSKIYIVNMGVWADDTSANIKTASVLRALEVSERAKDSTMIIFNNAFTATEGESGYVPDTEVAGYIGSAIANVTKLRAKGQPRIAYFPAGSVHYGKAIGTAVAGADDSELISLTSDIKNDNVVLVENCHYGALLAKIATTAYYVEVGRDALRTISEFDTIKYVVDDTTTSAVIPAFPVRSDEESTALMKAGILFGESDPYRVDSDGNSIQVICIGVSTGFAQTDDLKTTACLLHALRNNNHQIREVMVLLAQQLKENETVDAIANFKLAVNTYLESEEKAAHIKEYTCNIYESTTDPYNLKINLSIAGINATYLIEYNNSIMEPSITTEA